MRIAVKGLSALHVPQRSFAHQDKASVVYRIPFAIASKIVSPVQFLLGPLLPESDERPNVGGHSEGQTPQDIPADYWYL
jgi:hypothetical protein